MRNQKQVEEKVAELFEKQKECEKEFDIAFQNKVLPEVLKGIKVKINAFKSKINTLLWVIDMYDDL